MAITSEEIHNQNFMLDRKGYNVDEVDVFLEHVAEEIDGLNAEIRRLTEQVTALRAEGEEPMDLDAAFAEPAMPAVGMSDEEKDARIAELEAALEQKTTDATAVAAALVTAQRAAKEVTDKAAADARQIHEDAEAEAADIIAEANAERARIENAIADLDASHKDTCEAYADSLRAFIEDANAKLRDINTELSKKKSVHARPQVRYSVPAQTQAPAPTGAVAPSYSTPAPQYTQPVKPVTVEKDLSGYGDASGDFDFDDLD